MELVLTVNQILNFVVLHVYKLDISTMEPHHAENVLKELYLVNQLIFH